MAKTKSNRKRGGAKQRGNWSNADHDARTAKRIASLNKKKRRRHEQQEEEHAAAELEEENNNHDTSYEPLPDKEKKTKKQHHERPIQQIRRLKKLKHRNNHNRLTSQVPTDAYKRSHLAHDNYDQIDSTKLRLATAQVQRKVDALKERLENWDPVTETKLAAQKEKEDKQSIEYKMKLDAQNRQMDREARTKAQAEYNLLYAKHGVNSSTNRRKANLKKKPRPGPESWKLRGAARPAWEVYDFDTRFVDVHMQAKEEANARARRVKNIFRECEGRFALDGNEHESENNSEDQNNTTIINGSNGNDKKKPLFPPPQPQCREYLSLLTQLGSLHLHRKNYSSARKSFLEAITLEGTSHPTSITNARYQLMNMYLSTNRPTSARKLWEMLEGDGSAYIKYSAALIEYVSWNLLHEEGSSAETAEKLLTQAIRGNVYVAFLLGWPDMFERAMEYTEEVCERGLSSKGGSILEAIEYGCCCYGNTSDGEEEDRGMGMWLGTEGSLDWVRSVVLRVLNESSNSNDDDRFTRKDLLAWEKKLTKEEEEFEKEREERENATKALGDGENDNDDDFDDDSGKEDEDEEPDVLMYAGMFRTAMDWLQDAGDFLVAPSYEYVNEVAKEEEEEDVIVEMKGDRANVENDGVDSSGDESGSSDGSVESESEKNDGSGVVEDSNDSGSDSDEE